MDFFRKTLDLVDTALEDAVISNRQGVDDTVSVRDTESVSGRTTSLWSVLPSRRPITQSTQVNEDTEGPNVEELKKEIESLKHVNQQLKRQVTQLERENKEIYDEGVKFSVEAGEQVKQCSILRNKLEEADRRISRLNQDLQDLRESNNIMNETIAQLDVRNLDQGDFGARDIEAKYAAAQERVESLEKDLSMHLSNIECLKAEVGAGEVARSRCKNLEAEVGHLKLAKESLKRELTEALSREEKLNSQCFQLTQQVRSLETQLLDVDNFDNGDDSQDVSLILIQNEMETQKRALTKERELNKRLEQRVSDLQRRLEEATAQHQSERETFEREVCEAFWSLSTPTHSLAVDCRGQETINSL
eukprot:Blabericola_migrator_1__3877@NODE_216_length_11289_cov_52_870166_g183_i0_p6_GENE_NODE_216_length_11289_cov_52_870166_g183_i0NODE_216_length_11289_cov_52_870166_g183_i0_p6_ORF_typecomplete_len361_score96_99HOOK/PF05622_12/2_9e11CENPF_leu_zip/PF10473_9/0_0053CENPF_leu_zip/PF10473_9/7_5e06CENPF_leu_zip/PF10473_9/2e02Leu_zip/PF15294_6/8_4e05Leu_zip/PF15294_6/0_38ZapB/PF06005_12/2_2e05ZapB/PF06005_12/23Myosin_tail_1/PF01576_19/0_00037HAP1_N/PF04849_13/0_00017HAP1_N/PF04849_13/34DUF4763/PF15960_5/0_02